MQYNDYMGKALVQYTSDALKKKGKATHSGYTLCTITSPAPPPRLPLEMLAQMRLAVGA